MHTTVSHSQRTSQFLDSRAVIDPKNLRVLVVDSKSSSRQTACTLLRECMYQVTAVKTAKEAMQLLVAHSAPGPDPPFDLILKEHEPPSSNACRLLRKIAKTEHLRQIPIVVVSSQDDRDLVAKCLNLGATDYLVKPLRHNELRNIWTRIWLWRRSVAQVLPFSPHLAAEYGYASFSQASSSASEETKCDDEEEPTSKEGSAPDGNGNGSNGNGSNGSKEGNGTSRVEAKPHGNGNGNGSSDNKNGNGNSATKNGHNGSNGNGASTTLVPERPGSCALVGTAEGKPKAAEDVKDDHPIPKAAGARSAFAQYTGPSSSSRKRSASEMGVGMSTREADTGSHQQALEQSRSKTVVHRDRLQVWSVAGGSTPSTHTASEDTIHPSQGGVRQNMPFGLLPHGHDYASASQSASQVAALAALQNTMQNNVNRNLPHLQGHVQGWNAQHHASHHNINSLAHQAAPGHPALHNTQQMQHGFAGLFSNPYGIAPQMLQQLHHPLGLNSMYGASTSSGSGHGLPQGASVDGLAPHFFGHVTPELMAAEAAAQAAVSAQRGLHPHPENLGTQQQQFSMLMNSILYHSALTHQQHQQHMQAVAHPMAAAAAAAAAASSQHTQPSIPHQQNWRPAHPFQAGYMPPVKPPPTSAPETSIMSGGNGTGTNGASGGRNRTSHIGNPAEPHRRRAAALDKYRKKRKNLKFSKTIRYESRKQLAQQRPRIKGQFVKHIKPAGAGQDGDMQNAQSKSNFVQYWPGSGMEEQNQNYEEDAPESYEDEEYDQDDDMDEMDDDDDDVEEEEQKGDKVIQEEEADVVNSLRELRNPDRMKADTMADSKAQAVGLPHGQPSHGSRGSHGYGSVSRSISHGFILNQPRVQPSAENRVHSTDNAGRNAGSSHHQHASNNGGKNGSDSGSNSPDENGRGEKHKHPRER